MVRWASQVGAAEGGQQVFPSTLVQGSASSQAVDRVDLLEEQRGGLVDGGHDGATAAGEAVE